MKLSKLFVSSIFFLLATSFARAQVIAQDISLSTGWNAVYLEVTPEDATPASVFATSVVARVGCYLQNAYADTEQYNEDGVPIGGLPISFLMWDRRVPSAATLKKLIGGQVYLVYTTAPCSISVLGVPAVPRFVWRNTSASDAMMNFIGASLDVGNTTSLYNYLGEGPFGQAGTAYAVGGTNSATPSFVKLGKKATLSNGAAVAVTGLRSEEWPGVIAVTLASATGGLSFDDKTTADGFSVRNAGTASRIVRVSHVLSTRASDAAPGLRLRVPGASALEETVWTNFEAGTSIQRTLSTGEVWNVTFCANPSSLTDPHATYASLLRVEDVTGGTGMRVFVPVTATAVTNASTIWPKGLWIGTVELSKVNRADGSEPQDAGSPLHATILLHVDAAGSVTMLQRVVVGTQTKEDGTTESHLYRELSDVPSGYASRRVSCVVMDTAHRSVAASANPNGTASAFGTAATFRFTVDAKSSTNPFRHAWHPMHDGKTADYSADLPSGDIPSNYLNPVKPELFSVTNTITFTWGGDAAAWNPDAASSGQIDWTLGGLRTGGAIRMRGEFLLRRVANLSTIEGK